MSLDISRQQDLAEEILGEIARADGVTGYATAPASNSIPVRTVSATVVAASTAFQPSPAFSIHVRASLRK